MKINQLFLCILLFISALTNAQDISTKTFDGNINGKIPITLTLTFDKGTVFGNVVYKKKGIPITIIGYQTENTLFCHELMPDGQVTGIYSATIKGDKITGIWNAVNSKARDLTLSLNKVKEQVIPRKILKSVTGTYRYSFGEEGGAGEMLVQQMGADRIAISFSNVTAAPAYNIAEIGKTVLKYTNNKAIYSNNEYGKCKFIITFLENGARVDFVENAYECGFGHNASTEGNYIRINSSIPKWEDPDN
jgi:hypothetical protein